NRAVTGKREKSLFRFPEIYAHRFAASELHKYNGAQASRWLGAGRAQLLGSRMECVDHVGRDTAPSRHVVSVPARPFPDRRALLAVDSAPPATGSGTPATPTTDTAAGRHPLLQISAQFRGILVRKVNLVGHPVKPEFDSFVGGARTVEIIDQGDGHFLRHWLTLAFLPEQLLSR